MSKTLSVYLAVAMDDSGMAIVSGVDAAADNRHRVQCMSDLEALAGRSEMDQDSLVLFETVLDMNVPDEED